MRSADFVLVRGIDDTRATLARWNATPWTVLRTWLAGAASVTMGLLFAVLVVAHDSTPDPTPVHLPGLTAPATLGAVGHILFRNSLVLALHSFACLAGFIAGSSLPLEAARHNGAWRVIHDHAGRLAILFVVAATTFSLATQAYVLGFECSTLAAQGHVAPEVLMLGLLPHAIPELIALFLPLAAWIIASRRGDWHELLAATIVTTAIAAPVLVLAAFLEVFVSPHAILAARAAFG